MGSILHYLGKRRFSNLNDQMDMVPQKSEDPESGFKDFSYKRVFLCKILLSERHGFNIRIYLKFILSDAIPVVEADTFKLA